MQPKEGFGVRKSIGVLVSIVSVAVLAACTKTQTHSQDQAQAAVIESLRKEVAELRDREQIHEVYLHYMRGFDRNDVELMRSAFWPDVQINYGRQSNTFDEFVTRHLYAHTEKFKTWGHLLTNEAVELAGEVAYVEIYVTRLASRKKDGKSDIISGRYIDRLERRDGQWRIAAREFVPHFFTESDMALDAYIKASEWSDSACGMGTWDKHDPSYRRPLTRRENPPSGPACAP